MLSVVSLETWTRFTEKNGTVLPSRLEDSLTMNKTVLKNTQD